MTIEAKDSKFNSNSAGETPRLFWVKIVPEPLFFEFPFSKKLPNKKPIIAITGLNPHCESIDNINEDEIIDIDSKIKINNRLPITHV